MRAEKFLIKNELIETKETFDVINPYSGKAVRKVYKTKPEHINQSLDYLTSTFEKYRHTPVYIKSELLEKISNNLKERKEELAMLLTLETGKPIKLSRIELDRAIFTFKTGAEEARRLGGEITDIDQLRGGENKIGLIRRFPIGVILAITPWNFPINLVAHKLSPALASGNTVLLKPASASVVCGLEIGKIVKESAEELGLDFTPVNVVTSSGSEIEKFVSDDRIKMISFTGSPEVGWNLKKKLSRQRISLELGGNAGVIIDSSADLAAAIPKIVMGAFAHSGQSCISVQRVFVHRSKLEDFKKSVTESTLQIKYGDPFNEETISGPMINEEEAKRAERWLEEAKNLRAEYLTGGIREGAVLQPTIVINASRETNINSKEVFAPIMTVREFENFEDAVKEVNDSDYGLQAGVFTNDFKNIMYAFDTIETGGVVINDVPTFRMDSMPYGGVKQSGTGKEGIKYAIEEMTERKILIINK